MEGLKTSKNVVGSANKIGKNAVMLTASKMLVMLISLVTSMLLSRFRTLEEYGTYSQLTTIVNVAVSIFMLGLPNSLNYFYARADGIEEKDTFLSNYYTLLTVLSAVAGVVLCAAIPFLVMFYSNQSIVTYWYILALLPWTKVLINSRSNMLVSAGQTNRVISYNILNGICLLGIIVLIRIANQTFECYMLLYIAVELLFGVVVYYEANRLSGQLKVAFDKKLIKSILIYSIPIGLATSVSTINRELDKLVVGNLLNTEQLAIYSNAAKELPLVFIQQSFMAVLLPSLARMIKKGKYKKAAEIWADTVDFCFIIMCFFVAAILVFAPQMMVVLYSEKYLPGSNVFRIYGLVLLWRTTYFGMILNVTGHTKEIMYSSVFSLFLNMILNYPFFYIWGMTGPAIATFLSVGIVNIGQLVFSSKILNVSVRDIFHWGKLLKILILNFVFALAIYGAITPFNIGTNSKDILICIVIGLVWMCAYFALMFRPLKSIWKKTNASENA